MQIVFPICKSTYISYCLYGRMFFSSSSIDLYVISISSTNSRHDYFLINVIIMLTTQPIHLHQIWAEIYIIKYNSFIMKSIKIIQKIEWPKKWTSKEIHQVTSIPKTCKSMLQQLSIDIRIQLNFRIQSLWTKNCNNKYEQNPI